MSLLIRHLKPLVFSLAKHQTRPVLRAKLLSHFPIAEDEALEAVLDEVYNTVPAPTVPSPIRPEVSQSNEQQSTPLALTSNSHPTPSSRSAPSNLSSSLPSEQHISSVAPVISSSSSGGSFPSSGALSPSSNSSRGQIPEISHREHPTDEDKHLALRQKLLHAKLERIQQETKATRAEIKTTELRRIEVKTQKELEEYERDLSMGG